MGAPDTAELMEGMPANVVHALARRGNTPTDLATAEVVRPLPSDAVLLTGSYATREFKPTSDLDLLVLTDGRPGKRPPRPPTTPPLSVTASTFPSAGWSSTSSTWTCVVCANSAGWSPTSTAGTSPISPICNRWRYGSSNAWRSASRCSALTWSKSFAPLLRRRPSAPRHRR